MRRSQRTDTVSWVEDSNMSNILNTPRVQSPTNEDYPSPADSDSDSQGSTDSEDEEDDQDESSQAESEDLQPPPKQPWTIPEIPLFYRGILKCALAYFIASLFTFSPILSSLISDIVSGGSTRAERHPLPSGHMVATVAVYFNPAKTMGAMFEADMFCLIGFCYAAIVCLTSMGLFWWLDVQPGLEWLADLVTIALVGISFSILCWLKVWMANPQFNTACSMTSIIIFVVVVKEGGWQTLLSMAFIVFCGTATSNLVCYLVWPQTAAANLQGNMAKTLDSFATVLDMLTSTFLLEQPDHHVSPEKLQNAVDNHQSSFTSLKKNLNEAKKEWMFTAWIPSNEPPSTVRPIRSSENVRTKAYEDAVDSMNRLAQHLNGLRSGIRLQYELTQAGMIKRRRSSKRPKSGEDGDEKAFFLQQAAVMFGELVDDLGPPLKSLSTTCTSSLKRLRESFVQSHRPSSEEKMKPHEFFELVDNIERSLMRFESTSNHAVMRLYRKSDPADGEGSVLSIVSADGNDNSMLMNQDNEHIFLVYFFIFTLQEFATELSNLVDAMERIYNFERNRLSWWGLIKHAAGALKEKWTGVSRWAKRRRTTIARPKMMSRPFSSYVIPKARRRPVFPKVRPHAPNTVLTPARSNLTFLGKIKQMVWRTGQRLTERDSKFAIKAGAAIALLASPAFFDATREIFLTYNGDWALISFFVVMSPTIGATNKLSLARVLWTVVGATVALSVYTIGQDMPWVLAAFGFFFSLPCFYYYMLGPSHAASARFALLTYNLTCLYCYNVRHRDLDVMYVAYHRALAVTIGVLYAAFISRFWWPAEARREMGKALSEFCLNMGWLYTRLVASNSFAPEYRPESDEDHEEEDEVSLVPQQSGKTRLNNSIHEFMAMELHLQIKLIELQGLLAQTQHEPRLKGPFPVQLYRGVLTSLQRIMDQLHSMRCVTTREEWYTSVRQDFIVPVNKERYEMVGNIILFFSTLASTFTLKMPLPPYLPPAEASRERLVDAIRKLDVVRNRDVKGSRQLLFFAYALTMKGVTQELEKLGRTMQDAFGVIGETREEFEGLFRDDGRQRVEGHA